MFWAKQTIQGRLLPLSPYLANKCAFGLMTMRLLKSFPKLSAPINYYSIHNHTYIHLNLFGWNSRETKMFFQILFTSGRIRIYNKSRLVTICFSRVPRDTSCNRGTLNSDVVRRPSLRSLHLSVAKEPWGVKPSTQKWTMLRFFQSLEESKGGGLRGSLRFRRIILELVLLNRVSFPFEAYVSLKEHWNLSALHTLPGIFSFTLEALIRSMLCLVGHTIAVWTSSWS